MPDATKPNLEPIEEDDLNLKEKFLGETKPEKAASPKEAGKSGVEVIPVPEKSLERPERKEGAAEKDETYAKIISQVTAVTPVQDDQVVSDAHSASKEQDAESRINNLVSLAETKGVAHAVKVARHLEDNYVLDEFHDKLLASELHDELIKKGLIKEI